MNISLRIFPVALFLSVFLRPPWCDSDSQLLRKTANSRAKKEKKNGQEQEEDENNKCWDICQLFFSVREPCWAWLGVIRVLILLHLPLHSHDVSNAIQNDQNEINHESDGSSWLLKLRRNSSCRRFINSHFVFHAYVSFIQYKVPGAMWKLHCNWCSAFPFPSWVASPSSPQRASTRPLWHSPFLSPHSIHLLQPSWATSCPDHCSHSLIGLCFQSLPPYSLPRGRCSS